MKTYNLLLIAILVFIGGQTWGQDTISVYDKNNIKVLVVKKR